MFYCERCRSKNDWPKTRYLVQKACEVCGKIDYVHSHTIIVKEQQVVKPMDSQVDNLLDKVRQAITAANHQTAYNLLYDFKQEVRRQYSVEGHGSPIHFGLFDPKWLVDDPRGEFTALLTVHKHPKESMTIMLPNGDVTRLETWEGGYTLSSLLHKHMESLTTLDPYEEAARKLLNDGWAEFTPKASVPGLASYLRELLPPNATTTPDETPPPEADRRYD